MTESALVPIAVIGQQQRVAGLAVMFVDGRRSEHTRRAYTQHLNTWITWCHANGVDVLEARHAQVQLWLAHREEAGDSESTRAARLAAVSSWYRWLQREDVVSRNPADLQPEERPRFNSAPTPALSNHQGEQLLGAADRHSLRTSALVALMLYTGARIAELLNADTADIIQVAGITVLRITGKGRKKRDLPLIPAVHERVMAYLERRFNVDTANLPALLSEVRPRKTPLLATRTGRRLTAQQARADLLSAGQLAGLDPEVLGLLTPHSTRATYATSNLEAGTPLRDVQYALGHEDPRTTEGYDRSKLRLDDHPSTRLATMIKPPPRPTTPETQL